MFERFTDRARSVVVAAQEESRRLGHSYIGTEHLLLGLSREGQGIAAQVLASFDVGIDDLRAAVVEIVGTCDPAQRQSGHIPFTARAKKTLELSLREALTLGHNYIGTEHILLGILREGEGLAGQILVSTGIDIGDCRQRVHDVLAEAGGSQPVQLRRLRFTQPAVSAGNILATPAATAAIERARSLCAGGPMGSHHLLLALLEDEASLAAAALQAVGLSRQRADDILSGRTIEGTSDESPDAAGGRRVSMRVEDDRLIVEVDDPSLASAAASLLAELRARSGVPGMDQLSGGLPGAKRFADVFRAIADALPDLRRNLGRGRTDPPEDSGAVDPAEE